jgi:hypothetical protein
MDDDDDDDNEDDDHDDDDNDDSDDAKGGNQSNRTVVGQQCGRPHDWHPAHGQEVVHVQASAVIRGQ